jgi:DNA-binding MarR family transcriptional regulator
MKGGFKMTIQPIPEEDLMPLIDQFWENFSPVQRAIRVNFRRLATEQFDISMEQYHILRHIREGVTSVSELATVKQISRSAISQSVDALVEKGLITRQQRENDRRCVELALTSSGNEMMDTIFEENRAWLSKQLTTLNLEEITAILESIKLLRKALENPNSSF